MPITKLEDGKMNRNNDHDWGKIFTLWACMFSMVVVTTGWVNGDMHGLGVFAITFAVALAGSEIIGR